MEKITCLPNSVFLGTFVEILFVTSDNFDVVDFLRLQVVCEMEWLSLYPGSPSAKSHDEHKKVKSGVRKAENRWLLLWQFRRARCG